MDNDTEDILHSENNSNEPIISETSTNSDVSVDAPSAPETALKPEQENAPTSTYTRDPRLDHPFEGSKEPKTEPNRDFFTQNDINRFRHKAELPLYAVMVVLNVLIVLSIIFCCILSACGVSTILAGESGDLLVGSFLGITEDIDDYGPVLLGTIVGVLIILPFTIYAMYAEYRARAVKITKNNFPELYYTIQEYSARLGLKKVPNAYVIQENGVLNAFSAFIIRKQYITINVDLFEIAYREYHDMDVINFVIAHEMAHIRLRHATFGIYMSILFANYVPIISTTYMRAREYSCDRIAQKLTKTSGIEAIMTFAAGKHLYKAVDIEDYLECANEVRGFFVFITNLISTHPILTKRIQALAKGEGSGKLL